MDIVMTRFKKIIHAKTGQTELVGKKARQIQERAKEYPSIHL